MDGGSRHGRDDTRKTARRGGGSPAGSVKWNAEPAPTRVTRAFSGRPARGIVNRFLAEHSDAAPLAYPEIHHVTSPLRAPFTHYEEPAGDGELNESVRGHGVRHAVGELISCPFCLAVWIATALTGGMVLAPRLTRAACVVMTAVAAADTLQLGYDAAKQLPAAVGGN